MTYCFLSTKALWHGVYMTFYVQGSDQSFLIKLNENFAKHQDFGVVKGRSQAFIVKHYAGKVGPLTDYDFNRNSL